MVARRLSAEGAVADVRSILRSRTFAAPFLNNSTPSARNSRFCVPSKFGVVFQSCLRLTFRFHPRQACVRTLYKGWLSFFLLFYFCDSTFVTGILIKHRYVALWRVSQCPQHKTRNSLFYFRRRDTSTNSWCGSYDELIFKVDVVLACGLDILLSAVRFKR